MHVDETTSVYLTIKNILYIPESHGKLAMRLILTVIEIVIVLYFIPKIVRTESLTYSIFEINTNYFLSLCFLLF